MAVALCKQNFLTTSSSYSSMALAPASLTRSAVKTAFAYFSHDQEALIDEIGKTASALDLLISGTSAMIRGVIYLCVWLEDKVLKELPHVFQMILLPYAIIGLVLSFFELVYESINIIRGCILRSQLKFSDRDEDIKNNAELIRNQFFNLSEQDKGRIETYLDEKFSDPSQADLKDCVRSRLEAKFLKRKLDSLCRRVSKPAAEQILELIRSNELHDLKSLTEIIDIQTKKMLITHTIALFSIILSTLCYAFLLVNFPNVMYVSLALALASIILFIIYYALDKGFLNQKGYTFSMSACIPNWAKRIFSDKAAHEVHHPCSSREIQLLDMPSPRSTLNHH